MPGGTPLTEAGYVQQVTETFGSDAPAVLARYAAAAFGSPSEALTVVLADHSWSVPAYDTHRLMARHVPTYAYESPSGPRGSPSRPSFPVGSHMLELPYLFGMRYLEPPRRLTSARHDRLLGTVASVGNPNGPGLPTWPGFQSGQYVQALAAGAGGIHRTEFGADHNYAFWHDLGG